ncbi:MAG TPA: protein kinase [Vicinamibacterales bacterium]|nr:protein kinase [Vicinamibacterales bacterium]
MPLDPGTRLGSYEVTAAIGAGGMGEVYRARDTKLDRDVALKILPESLAGDPDRLMRFEREAKTLASLNHPNIAQIYGLEEGESARGDRDASPMALVMELVEGEDLAERTARGAVPLDEALPIARQIADALEAAHGAGIIHRDLKPANVKVRGDGTVKVLDFGLAKAVDASGEGQGPGADMPTVTSPALTAMGVILGTAAYMAPEQAKGKAIDRRADIWAFGVLLFELLSGRRVFDGETISETIAAVLMKDPDWSALPPTVPTRVRRLVERCLTRDPRKRLQDIGEARIALEDVLAGQADAGDAGGAVTAPGGSRHWPWLGGGLLLGLAAGWLLFAVPGRPETAAAPTGVMRVRVPALAGLGSIRNPAAAPDDRFVVYQGYVGDLPMLYLHDFESGEVRPLAGTEGGNDPFLSPDGQWLAFRRGNELLKVRIAGGDAIKITETPQNFPGAAWTMDGAIVFPPGWLQGLSRVPADGGEPVPLTTVNTEAGEKGHWWPKLLPDGRHAIFTIWRAGAGLIDSDIAVLDLETGDYRTLLRGADAWFLPPGYLVYYHAGTYHTVPFDTDRLEVVGEPVAVVEDATDPMPQGTNELGLAISARGTLFYLTRQIHPPARLAIVTPGADPEFLSFPARAVTSIGVAPNGRTIAASSLESGVHRIRLMNLETGTDERLDLAGSNWDPYWKPDGSGFAFLSMRKGDFDIYFKDLTTDGAEQPIRMTPTDEFPHGWSADGTGFFFVETLADGTQPLRAVTLDGTNVVSTVMQTTDDANAAVVSPDGRWLVYDAVRDGRANVYVRPYPGPGVEVRISPDGGRQPAWSPDGSELYYVREHAIVASSFTVAQDRIQPGAPEILFASPLLAQGGFESPLAVLGPRRFVVALLEDEPEPPHVNVVLNWSREVAALGARR